MTTKTDAQFTARFSGLTPQTFIANQTDLANYTPTTSLLNTGMMSDIGRATIYAPDVQTNFWAKFMKAPLGRGDSSMTARIGEVTSRAYNVNAPDTDLFNGQKPAMQSLVYKKNLSRQIAVEINDRYLKQMAQTPEMIGDVQASIMATSNVCYMDDMWVASKEFFTASTRSARSAQLHVMTNDVGDAGFANELNELIWKISQSQFGYKSTEYNANQFNTKSESVNIALRKDCEYPAFKKLYADTFHPDALRITSTIDYVDDFATPAGAPSGAGDLVGIVVDPRCYEITPMPEALSTEAFRNPARKSTAYFTTYEYAFGDMPFFNKAYIFAPEE